MDMRFKGLVNAGHKFLWLVLLIVVIASFAGSQSMSLTAAPMLQSCTPVVSSSLDVSSDYKIPISGFATISQGPISGHVGPESIDFKVKRGTQVVAAREGTVNRLGSSTASGYGLYVRIDHDDGEQSFYAHLSGYGGRASGRVLAGELIGYSGNTGTSTGEHLHFEVKVNNVSTPIRQIAGVHWFQVEKNGYNAFCNLDYKGGSQNDGYAYSSWITDPSIAKYDGMPDKCAKISSSNAVIFKNDNCDGESIALSSEKIDYTSLPFQPSSIYLGSGWSAIIDDGNGNYLCARRSLWDLTLDYYHPVANRPIDGNINRIYLYKNSTCGGLDTNNDGKLDSGKSLPVYGVDGIGGDNPIPQPGVTPSPPPESNPQDPNHHLVVFRKTNYVDVAYELEPGYLWDLEDREYRAIKIPGGWSYVLVDKHNNQQCFNKSHHNFQDYSEWHVRIDKIAVFASDVCLPDQEDPKPEPLGDGFVRFWFKKNYEGSSVKISWVGITADMSGVDDDFYWITRLSGDGYNFNDEFESVEVNDNRAVAVYEHDNLQGGVKCYSSDDSDFNNDTFDNGKTVANSASSLRFFTLAECNLRPMAPTEMWVHEAKKGSITLAWVRSSPDADGFHVKLYQNGSFQTVATLTEDQALQNALAVTPGATWMRSWTFTDVDCDENFTFVVSAYNDRAESINSRQVTAQVECDCNDPSFDGVGLYDLRYCKGESVQLTEPGWFNLADFNDMASSIYVKPGWSVELFENTDNVDGLTTCVPESKWDLSYDNFWLQSVAMDNKITRARVWNAPNCGRTLPMAGCDAVNTTNVTLFDHTHCLGLDQSLAGTGFHLLDDFDDLTSSVYVPPGKSARLYENANKEGNYVCIRDTKWDMLGDFYWWDYLTNTFNNVSAVETYDDDLCGGVPAPSITFPASDSYITDADYLIFEWENVYAGGYWVDLWGPNGFHQPSGHLSRNLWNFGELAPGEYTFRLLAEAYGESETVTEVKFTVHSSVPTSELVVNYSSDPDQVNKVTFNVANCLGDSVHYVFGHEGLEADSACVNGNSSIVHEYPYDGETVTYNAIVAGQSVVVTLYRLADCGEKAPSTGVSLFSEDDCRGDKRSFTTAGEYALSDFNDQTSALLVAPGWSVELFENFNSSDGHAFCATQDIWKMGFESYYASQVKMGDSVSNIRVYNNSTCGKELPQYGGCGDNIVYDGVVLFDYIHCGGSEQKFNQPGKYELGYGGSFNDLATSMHVAPGWSIKLYDTSSWTGEERCVYGGDMWDLGIDRYTNSDKIINNTVSSVEVFQNTTCKADPTEQPLVAPASLYPTGGIFTAGKPVTLRWNAIQGTDLYKVEISGGSKVETVSTTNSFISFTPQQSGTFSWKVRAVRGDVESEWSAVALFTVRSPETSTPVSPVLTPEPSKTPVPPGVTPKPSTTPVTPEPSKTPVPNVTPQPGQTPKPVVTPQVWEMQQYLPSIKH